MPRKFPPLLRFRENLRAKREEARRKRERERRRAMLICGAVLVLLIPVFIVGVVSERREAASGAAARATQVPPATETPRAAESTHSGPPPPAAEPTDDSDDDEEPEDERHLTFGQTAHFISTAGGDNTPLEFTVSAPNWFKPSKHATLYDAKASTVVKGDRQRTNVYFTVTVKNTSKKASWDANFVSSDVTETGDDDVVSSVDDGDIQGVGYLQDGGKKLKPRHSATVKDGYSVKSADNIQYELSIDGLAGYTIYFTR